MTTPCKCTEPGYCETHKRSMSPVRFRQCHDEPGYYEVFQRSIRGVGDVVARVTGALGIKKCVPCSERQEALNDLLPFHSPDNLDNKP